MRPAPSQQQQAIAWSYPDYTSNNFQQPTNTSNLDHSIHPLDNLPPTTPSQNDTLSSATTFSSSKNEPFTPTGIHNYRRNAAIGGVMTTTRPMDIPPWSPPSPSASNLANSSEQQQARQLVRPATCPDAFPSLSSSNFTVGSIPEPPPPWPVNMQAVQTPIDEKIISTPQGATPDEDEMLVFRIEDLKM
ncbi:hypothetical protein O0I10_004358 [Lichtheimia ornata]|uniref:Uncharacterized protein n=1 Tax=Lichtheimia ornata TaxID=688661 RepID=A0AAD7XZ50_9FUNG|nr:uncharacterized protein O0I10_004358 [Lichtheimia ornata]KAJ8659765.1 hypothetical protein O0I10_004358 [Lichtheimia ornata]